MRNGAVFSLFIWPRNKNMVYIDPCRMERSLQLFQTSANLLRIAPSSYRRSNVIKLARARSQFWCGTVVVGEGTRPRTIPLALLITRKETLGFLNFYAWFSYVPPNFYSYAASLPSPSCRQIPLQQ